MKLREALFFSSKDTAYQERSERYKVYRICLKEEQEEYTPGFLLPTQPPGPYYRPIYNISVSIVKDNDIAELHTKRSFHDVDKCEEFLKDWRIDIEQGWIPDEEDSKDVMNNT